MLAESMGDMAIFQRELAQLLERHHVQLQATPSHGKSASLWAWKGNHGRNLGRLTDRESLFLALAGYNDRLHVQPAEFGMSFGPAKVERFCEEKGGGVTIGVTTPKDVLQLRVSPTGKVRVFRKGIELKGPAP